MTKKFYYLRSSHIHELIYTYINININLFYIFKCITIYALRSICVCYYIAHVSLLNLTRV